MAIVRRPRVDRILVRLDKSERKVDDRGYLNVWGTVVSADQFLEYNKVDGAPEDGWIEFVPESTVFDEAALETLKNAPITLHHPPEMLDTSNTHRYQVGSVIELKRDGNKLRALHQITDKRAIDAIDEGIFQLSPGYTAEIDDTPGAANGRNYNSSQSGRIYNHHSIVPEARAGDDNALDKLDCIRQAFRMDGLQLSKPTKQKESKMEDDQETVDYELDGETFALPKAIVDKLNSQQKDAEGDDDDDDDDDDENEDKKKDEKDDKDDASDDEDDDKGKRGDAVTRKDLEGLLGTITSTIAKASRDDAKRRDAKSRELSEVTTSAKPHLALSYNYDGKSASTIMYDAIVRTNPDMKAQAGKVKKETSTLKGMFAMLRSPVRRDSTLGGDGRNHGAPPSFRMDAAATRRDERVNKTTQSFRRVDKIGQQLAQHAKDQFEDQQEKATG